MLFSHFSIPVLAICAQLAVATGDTFKLWTVIGILVVCGIALGVLAYLRKKKKK